MITIAIPGRGDLHLEHLVLDFNGTVAFDGELIPGVRERLEALAEDVTVHVVTADTFGRAKEALEGTPCRLKILKPGTQDVAKLQYIRRLGPARCVCVGNGRNDVLMLQAAALGIAVIGPEGAATAALAAASVAVADIISALDLLLNPVRLVATLRS